MYLQTTGTTIQAGFRLQINTLISPVNDYFFNVTLLPNVIPTYLPLLWFERVRATELLLLLLLRAHNM